MLKQGEKRVGFTIVEAMVSIVLTALVMAASYPLLSSTTRKMYQARDHYSAATVSLAQIERARDIPYEQLLSMLGKDIQVRVNEMGAVDPAGRFRRTTTVAVDDPAAGVTTVSVTAEISDRKTGGFIGEKEKVCYIFTAYLKPVSP